MPPRPAPPSKSAGLLIWQTVERSGPGPGSGPGPAADSRPQAATITTATHARPGLRRRGTGHLSDGFAGFIAKCYQPHQSIPPHPVHPANPSTTNSLLAQTVPAAPPVPFAPAPLHSSGHGASTPWLASRSSCRCKRGAGRDGGCSRRAQPTSPTASCAAPSTLVHQRCGSARVPALYTVSSTRWVGAVQPADVSGRQGSRPADRRRGRAGPNATLVARIRVWSICR
jgi:hypothetical protein